MHCNQFVGAEMAALTIRNVDDSTKTALRVRAAQHGVSMEEEARRILRDALLRVSPPGAPGGFGQRLVQRFESVASEDFTLPVRHATRMPPAWE